MFEPLFADYLIYGVLSLFVISVVGGYLGVYLVLSRYSILSDAIAHIALMASAATLVFGLQNIWISIVIVSLVSLLVEYLTKKGRFQSDSVLAMFITSSLALSVLLFSLSKGGQGGIESYLFGSIVTVEMGDFFAVLAISIVAISLSLYFGRALKLVIFDEEFATVCGLKTSLVRAVMIVCVASFITVSIKVIGVLLVSATLIAPALISLNFRLPFGYTLLLSSAVSAFSAVVALFISLAYPISTGAVVVIVLLFAFLISTLLGAGR